MRTPRVTLYFDAALFASLERIAGPFGEAGRVVAAAMREGRDAVPDLAEGPMEAHVQIVLHPTTRARLEAMAATLGTTWQGAARRVIAQWVVDYDVRTGSVRRAS